MKTGPLARKALRLSGLALILLPSVGCPRASFVFTLSPTSLLFSAVQGAGSPPDQVVTLTGVDDLPSRGADWTAQSDQPWMSVSPSSGVVHASESLPLTVHLTPGLQPEAWTGSTSTTGAPYADATTYAGWGTWIGDAMMIWGGDPAVPGKYYDPVSNTWFGTMSMTNAPSKRWAFTAVWTGTEVLVWGGYTTTAPATALNTGARYNPVTDTWTTMSTVGAPSARSAHRAVWTGNRMIVWGGDGMGYTYTNTGGIYDPATDTWVGATSTVNAPPARGSHAQVWTGSRMIVWGGENPGKFNTGYFYDPQTNTWSGTTTLAGAPSARSHLEGVWTGSEMIVWGGSNGSTNLNTGARYDPTTDTWTAMTTTGAPEARSAHVMVWTGSRMIAWGGVNAVTAINTGGLYQPPQIPVGTQTAQITVTARVGGHHYTKTCAVTLEVTAP